MDIDRQLIEANPQLVQFSSSIIDVLDANRLCSMATVGPTGAAHANIAYFAADRHLNLFVLTRRTTRHSRHVESNPTVAVTVFDSRQIWNQPHLGLQLFGRCTRVPEGSSAAAFSVYSAKHPDLLGLAKSSDDMLSRLESRFYLIDVRAIHIVDEARFGDDTGFTIEIVKS